MAAPTKSGNGFDVFVTAQGLRVEREGNILIEDPIAGVNSSSVQIGYRSLAVIHGQNADLLSAYGFKQDDDRWHTSICFSPVVGQPNLKFSIATKQTVPGDPASIEDILHSICGINSDVRRSLCWSHGRWKNSIETLKGAFEPCNLETPHGTAREPTTNTPRVIVNRN